MQKYRINEKIVQIEQLSIYKGMNKKTNEYCSIKKIISNCSWDQILNRKQVLLIKQNKFKFLPKIKQIVKQQHQYFIIYQEFAQNLFNLSKKNINNSKLLLYTQQIFNIIHQLHKINIILTNINHAYFFIIKQQIKLIHLTDIQQKQKDIYRYISPQRVLHARSIDQDTCIFALGCLITQLWIGNNLIICKNKKQYIYRLCALFPNQSQFFQSVPQVEWSKDLSFEVLTNKREGLQDLKKLLISMLIYNKNDRISLQQGLNVIKQIRQRYIEYEQRMNRQNEQLKKLQKQKLNIKLQKLKLRKSSRLKSFETSQYSEYIMTQSKKQSQTQKQQQTDKNSDIQFKKQQIPKQMEKIDQKNIPPNNNNEQSNYQNDNYQNEQQITDKQQKSNIKSIIINQKKQPLQIRISKQQISDPQNKNQLINSYINFQSKQSNQINIQIDFNYQQDTIQKLSQIPLIQKASKPLKDQKNIDDNVLPAIVQKTYLSNIIPSLRQSTPKRKIQVISNQTKYAIAKHQSQIKNIFNQSRYQI